MSEKVELPGDGDEPMDKAFGERKERRSRLREDKPEQPKDAKDAKDASATDTRGPLTPAQFEDDGWGETPVQMRGE